MEEGFKKLGLKIPFWDNFADCPSFYATASPEWVRDYYIKVLENKWFEYDKERIY